jgi:SAM-dependent methyltransferase
MFDLSDDDLSGATVLDCCAGGSSFAADTDAQVVAMDPAYVADRDQLDASVLESLRDGGQIIDNNAEHFDWSWYGEPARRSEMRTQAAQRFLTDLRTRPHRYVAGALPHLPFATGAFDLVVCSHLLFTWAHLLDADWHRAAITELARTTRREVRIFPLVVSGTGEPVGFLPELRADLHAAGHRTEIRPVPYRFQRGGDHMLVITVQRLAITNPVS